MKVKKFYIETYGCQMNVADSEVVAAILEDKGYQRTQEKSEADVILVNTCSVRENAEQRVRGRVQGFSEVKKKNPHVLVAIMGCMAERLGEALFEQEKNVNIVVGPDAYMDLPLLVEKAEKGEKAINIELSLGIQMMFSFLLVDGEKPLRLCKHCQKVFLSSRSNSAFCSPRCKNQYNVYKSRGKKTSEED